MQSVHIVPVIRAAEVGERGRRENTISLLSAENKSTFSESSGRAEGCAIVKNDFLLSWALSSLILYDMTALF